MSETIATPLIDAAEAEWLKYVNGTYSEADKRVFVAAFVKGIEWQRRRQQARARHPQRPIRGRYDER